MQIARSFKKTIEEAKDDPGMVIYFGLFNKGAIDSSVLK
jgi:hypothetical protein